eukprot:jgi/Picsp_1/2058/NSC_05523-R1_---NA---
MQREEERRQGEYEGEKRGKFLSLSHILNHNRGCGSVSETGDSAISPRGGETAMVVGNVSVNEGGNVTGMNFLIRMKHVKECSDCVDRAQMSDKENGRPSCISEESALRRWLKFHGLEQEMFDVMKSRGVSLKEMRGVDPQKAVEGLGMKKQKRKMMIAIEQYKQKGCIPLSKSKLNRNAYKKSRDGIGASLKDRFKRFRGDDTNKKSAESRVDAYATEKNARIKSADAEYCKTECGIARQRQIELALCTSLCAVLPRMGDGESLYNRDETSMVRRCGGLDSKYVICEDENTLFRATATCSKNVGELTLEQRLEKRHGAGIYVLSSGEQAVLKVRQARCNSADASNSFSIKRVRLKALEDELLVQKATVRHLEELIRDLKKDIECDSL